MTAHRYLTLITLSIVTCLIAISLLPDSKQSRYASLSGSGEKAAWIYQRLHVDPRKIDVAFFGPSHVYLAVHPRVVEDAYHAKTGKTITVANFAIYFQGRDLEYVLAKETIASNKGIKLIVLSLRHAESRVSHWAFCELADREDIIHQILIPNPSYLTNIACFERRQLTLLAKRFVPANDRPQRATNEIDGFLPTVTRVSDAAIFATNPYAGSRPILPAFLSDLEFRLGRKYVQRIYDLASSRGIRIAFLYIPDFRDDRPPLDAELFSRYGSLLLLPPQIRDNPRFRYDGVHLNTAGATAFSSIIGDALPQLLLQQ